MKKNLRGFTLIELMIVVAIIGILAAIAIPNFLKYQLRSKSGEGSTNVTAIKTSEISYFGSKDIYYTLATHPALVLSQTKMDWGVGNADFDELGWKPEGSVYFNYAADVSTAEGGYFTIGAEADIDSNLDLQCYQYAKTGSNGGVIDMATGQGCTQNFAPSVGAQYQNVTYKACIDGVF